MQTEINIQKRKRAVAKIGITFAVIILLLTFFSNTINNLLLPKVTAVEFSKGSLQETQEVNGVIEYSEKENISLNSGCTIKELLVKPGQTVKIGDMLALVESDSINIDSKREEIQIIGLQHEIDNLKSGSGDYGLYDYKAAVNTAKENMDSSCRQLNETKARYDAGTETKENLEQAQKSYSDMKQEYELKCRILEDKINDNKHILKQKQLELEIDKTEYEKLTKYLDQNGRMISDGNGEVTAVNFEKGSDVPANQTILEIVKNKKNKRITWELDPEKALNLNTGDKVDVSFDYKPEKSENSGDTEDKQPETKNIALKVQISGKQYLAGKNVYQYHADIATDDDVNIEEGQQAVVGITRDTPVYDYVVPKDCITEGNNGCYIYLIEERQNAAGREKYVSKVEVKLLDSNSCNCAVSGAFGGSGQIVLNASKPLSDGMQVRLR